MSVNRRKDRPDTWQARLRGPDGRVISKCFSKRSLAMSWYSEQLAARERGQLIDPRDSKITLRQFYDEWSQRQVWERNTTSAMNLSIRSATFADVPLGRIRRSHLEKWIKQLVADGKAPSTIHTRFVNVRFVLRAAVRDRLIASPIPPIPPMGVVLPRQRCREAAMRLPTP